jgi:methylated-DNA-protein-cysteine methyltransferase related protein
VQIDDDFVAAVRAVVRSVPAGEVITYGEIALEAGYPKQSRAVGRVLAMGDDDLPWWRVVNAVGRLVPGHEHEHRRRLAAEGVTFTPKGHVADLRH